MTEYLGYVQYYSGNYVDKIGPTHIVISREKGSANYKTRCGRIIQSFLHITTDLDNRQCSRCGTPSDFEAVLANYNRLIRERNYNYEIEQIDREVVRMWNGIGRTIEEWIMKMAEQEGESITVTLTIKELAELLKSQRVF